VEKPLRGAWKYAKPADSHFSTATAATDVFVQGRVEQKNQIPTSSEINLLQQKNGLDFEGHHHAPE
jgi:hypothetical protein